MAVKMPRILFAKEKRLKANFIYHEQIVWHRKLDNFENYFGRELSDRYIILMFKLTFYLMQIACE